MRTTTKCPECGKPIRFYPEDVVEKVTDNDNYYDVRFYIENSEIECGAIIVVEPGAVIEVYIDTFYADPPRRGLGRNFYRYIEQYFVSRGFNTIFLDYMDKESYEFWTRMGFKATGDGTQMMKVIS